MKVTNSERVVRFGAPKSRLRAGRQVVRHMDARCFFTGTNSRIVTNDRLGASLKE
jgi:hypothetical protein